MLLIMEIFFSLIVAVAQGYRERGEKALVIDARDESPHPLSCANRTAYFSKIELVFFRSFW
ncbi:hypothetical protein KSD_56420 [Ktedonobacter sp. SOSP1-85]|nr:hypothetical protein KSD_56420 [Ktedonobacter sp. SOSP1-85]